MQKCGAAPYGEQMKLFLISQTENQGYDTYDSAVVCAPDEDAARMMDPGGINGELANFDKKLSSWCTSADNVTVELIGDAAPHVPVGVVCASFNAG
jgi:hypothetical protein